MRIWFFTEQQYHPGWERIKGPIRNTPPTSAIDPEVAADLFDRYYEEFAVADELGINIAVNEHHSSFQSMSNAPYLSIAALARTTKKARLLSIGTPVAQRPDPLRVAEEIALADIMSRGRTEAGMIKSVPWEYFNSNANPMRLMDRFWEAHDLIIKALSTRDGPFAWHGEFFNYRNVNVVPRPYQDPHPPIWITGQSPGSARGIAQKGYIAITSQSGGGAIPFFAAYREHYKAAHGREAPNDRLGYLGYMAIAHSESEARARAQRVHKWVEFLASQHPGFQHAAGYVAAADLARLMSVGKGAGAFFNYTPPTIDELREKGIMLWGTPDQVYQQIEAFYRRTGGFGNLLAQMGGYGTQADTIETMTLLAREVMPRLQELSKRQLELA